MLEPWEGPDETESDVGAQCVGTGLCQQGEPQAPQASSQHAAHIYLFIHTQVCVCVCVGLLYVEGKVTLAFRAECMCV